jgi:hypothetical protein
MIKTILAVFTLLVSSHCFADKPQCYGTYGGYCQYNGYVQNLYINSGNVILVYFDTAMDEGEWEKAGVAATQRSAAAILVDENPEFAKMFYSTALSAQATKRKISVQLRGVHSGYLKIDRIWLEQ